MEKSRLAQVLRVHEYSYINCDKPFAFIKFEYGGDSQIEFTIREGEDITMAVDDGIPVDVVLEAIKIVQSRTLTF